MNAETKPLYHKLRQRMLQDQERLERQLSDTGSASAESLRVSTGELSAADNHPADTGTEVFERGRDLAVHDTQQQELERIEAALERMERGTYGICAVCGEEIPQERLEALPYTAYCTRHAPDREPSDRRPAEEDVMTAPPKGAGLNRQRAAGKFDDAGAWDDVEDYGTSTSPAMSVKPGPDDYKN